MKRNSASTIVVVFLVASAAAVLIYARHSSSDLGGLPANTGPIRVNQGDGPKTIVRTHDSRQKSAGPPPTATKTETGTTTPYQEAERVYRKLTLGLTPEACGAVKEDLLQLIKGLEKEHPVWSWAMDQAVDCFRQLSFEAQQEFVARLMRIEPENSRIQELAAVQALASGRMREAISILETLVQTSETASTWENLGVAQYFLATGVFGDRIGDAEISALLSRSRDSLSKAIELTRPAGTPWQYEKMAEVELASGNHAAAIGWADKVIGAIRSGANNDFEANGAASLYLGVGRIYYRAGQRDTGIAYINQGISMANTPSHRAALEQEKTDILGGRS